MVTGTHLTTSSNTASASSYTTASITPGGNRLVLAGIVTTRSGGGSEPTLSGNGLTWVQVATRVSALGQPRITLFRAMGASPSSEAVTITTAVAQSGCLWTIFEFAGVDTGGTNGSAAVVQPKTGGDETGLATSLSITLDNAIGSGNATAGVFGHMAQEGTTPGAGYNELGDTSMSGPSAGLESEWRSDGNTTVNASWTTMAETHGIAFEIKATAAGPETVNLTPATLSLTGQATSPTPGSVTASLTAGAMTIAAQALAPTPTPVTVNLTAATVTFTAQAPAATPGMVTVELPPVALMLESQALSPVGPPTVTVELGPALLTLAAQALGAAPGSLVVALAAATLLLDAQAFGVRVPRPARHAAVTVEAGRGAAVATQPRRATLAVQPEREAT